MSNSPLVNYTKLSPNCSKPRDHVIDTITIHHMAGNLSVESCGNVFASPARNASSNYGIGSDGRIGLYVEESNRSWCSSNRANDQRAVTIEVANDGGDSTNWHVSDAALTSLIKLCADICKRNNIKELKWQNNKNLIGQPDLQNITIHQWFAATACPGPYLLSKLGYVADEANKILKAQNTIITPTQTPIVTPTTSQPTLTYEQFEQYMNTYMDKIAKQPADNWSLAARTWAESKGYLQGDESGLRYKTPITRQELVQVLYRIMGGK